MTELTFSTHQHESILDITGAVADIVGAAKSPNGLCHLYVPHATAGIVINENDDPNILEDLLDVLRQLAPRGIFRHDRIDGNGDAHIKSALIGPGELVPYRNSRLQLGTWQSIMLCDFDGPTTTRRVIVTLIPGE